MPQLASIAMAAFSGGILGSFLNVVAHRLPLGESLSKPRSRCTSCGTQIAAYDNVPVLSWLVLRGRCRHCHTHISARYPAVELTAAVTFAAIVAVRGLHDDLLLQLPFAACLIALAAIDLDHRILPNKIVYPMAVWGVVATALVDSGHLPAHLIAGAIAFTVLLLVVLAYPAGMGMGDVKLAGVMGLYLGTAVAPAMLMAFLSGSVVGVAIMVREGAAARKKAVPFGVFLALGGIAAVLVGPELVDLYRTHFLGR
jgi:leader peptidase (prepilin peptidase) / N-methyltransferase